MNARSLVRRASVAFDRLRPPPAGLVVLIYHRIGAGTRSNVDLPAEVFDEQMALLAATRPVLTLDAAVQQLAAGTPVEGVVVTFDDGTPDFHDVAVPILQRHRVPATLYVATGPVDRGEPMPWGVPSVSWAALRDTLTTGLVTIGSHTRDHLLLDRLDRATVAEQLDASIASITTEIGEAPQHFAYPKAVRGNTAAEIEVRSRFRSATMAGNRVNLPGADLHRLARTPVHRTDSIDTFDRKIHGGMRLEGTARDVVARWRTRRSGGQ